MQKEGQRVCRSEISVGLDVGGVDFDADALADEVDRQDEPCVRALADEAADNAFERAVRHFDHHSFANQRAGIVLQIAFEQAADAFDFVIGNRRRLSFERHDVDDAGAFQDRRAPPLA